MKSFVQQAKLKQQWIYKMEFVVLFLSTVAAGFFLVNRRKHNIKQKTVKRDEIIQAYEKELLELLERYKDNKDMQVEQKKIFLKNCNDELSRNIFFTKNEASQVLQRLAKL